MPEPSAATPFPSPTSDGTGRPWSPRASPTARSPSASSSAPAYEGKVTYSNVISTLCLFLLLGGGTAFAASHLGKNSVGAAQLKKTAITAAKVKAVASLTVTFAGTGSGSGSVISSPAGIDCGSTWSTQFEEGRLVAPVGTGGGGGIGASTGSPAPTSTPSAECKVPNLKGKKLKAAKKLLRKAGKLKRKKGVSPVSVRLG